MPPGITIQPATVADADALALIGAASFLDAFAGQLDGPSMVRHCTEHHCASAYRALLNDGAHCMLALEDRGAPVGYAMITRPDLPEMRQDDLELRRIYLLSRFHGSGAAPRLLDAAIAAARTARRLLLGVYEGNARALAFYRKHGFTRIATRQLNMGGTLCNDLVLARDLSHGN